MILSLHCIFLYAVVYAGTFRDHSQKLILIQSSSNESVHESNHQITAEVHAKMPRENFHKMRTAKGSNETSDGI